MLREIIDLELCLKVRPVCLRLAAAGRSIHAGHLGIGWHLHCWRRIVANLQAKGKHSNQPVAMKAMIQGFLPLEVQDVIMQM